MNPTLAPPEPELTFEQSVLNPEFTAFIESVSWGTEGARYRLKDYQETLDHIPQPFFLALKEAGTLMALRMVLEKRVLTPNGPLHAFYHSLFCVSPSAKGQGYGSRLAREMLERLIPAARPQGLIYSHVEHDNIRSARVHERLGYQALGDFSVMSFSRFFPRPSSRMTLCPAALKDLVLRALHRQYLDHAMTDFDRSLDLSNYFVILRDGELLAGVQVLPQRWQIEDLGGAGGQVAMKLLPRLPLVRDLFNPDDFQFLKFGNVYFKEGHAKTAFELWNSVLAQYRKKTAMLFVDKTSPVFQGLADNGRMGLLNALTETPVRIYGKPVGLPESALSAIRSRPKVISPIDI